MNGTQPSEDRGSFRTLGSKAALLAVVALLGLIARPAGATALVFHDEAAFRAAAAADGIAFQQQGFEGLASGFQGPLNLDGITVESALGGVFLAGAPDQASEGSRAVNVFGSEFPVRFTFARPTPAVGLDLIDALDVGATSLSASINDAAFFEVLASSTPLADGNLRFLGFISPATGIRSLDFTQDDTTDALSFDRLQVGREAYAVAEPSGIGLALVAVLGLGALLRRRSS